jgi:eukaryotic-like serine/threonine-protein kinase
VEQLSETNSDIILLNIDNGKTTPFLNSHFFEGYPEISPDGKWMAYVCDASGPYEVYVQPFPGGGGSLPISNKGGTEPLWSRDGKHLFYRQENQVWFVDVQEGDVGVQDGNKFSKPKLLFDKPGYGRYSFIRGWDISRDGKFLMVKGGARTPQPLTEMVLVQNWFEEVRRPALPGKSP